MQQFQFGSYGTIFKVGFGEEYPFALILWNCEWKSNGLKFSQDIFYFHVKIKEKFDVLKEIYAKQFIPYKMVKGGQWGSKDIYLYEDAQENCKLSQAACNTELCDF